MLDMTEQLNWLTEESLNKLEKKHSNALNKYSAILSFLYLACIGVFIVLKHFILKLL